MRLVQLTDAEGDPVFIDPDKVAVIYKSTKTITTVYLDGLTEVIRIKIKGDPQAVADIIGNGYRRDRQQRNRQRDPQRNQQRERPVPPSTAVIKGQG